MKYLNNKAVLGLFTSLVLVNSAVAVEKVYAVVNGDKITQQEIAIALKNPQVKFDSLPAQTQKNVLDKIVEQKLLSQNAMKTDVVNDKIYKQTLKSLKQDLALQVWMQKESKNIKVSDNEVSAFYKENTKLFNVPTQFRARHILLKTKSEAEDLIKTLNKSSNTKAKFIKLAKEKSVGPSGKDGGDLGFFTADKMVPTFSDATKKLEIGKITQSPVKTQFGFHIIYLEDKKKASTATFEKAKNNIKQQLAQDKFIKYIQEIANKLKKKAKIEYK